MDQDNQYHRHPADQHVVKGNPSLFLVKDKIDKDNILVKSNLLVKDRIEKKIDKIDKKICDSFHKFLNLVRFWNSFQKFLKLVRFWKSFQKFLKLVRIWESFHKIKKRETNMSRVLFGSILMKSIFASI